MAVLCDHMDAIGSSKGRIIAAATDVLNEISILTEEDLSEVRERIETECSEILGDDPHTYHKVEVLVTILPCGFVHGQSEISLSVVLWQRLVNNRRIILEKSSRRQSTFECVIPYTTCRQYKFMIRHVPKLSTLAARQVNEVLGKCTTLACRSKAANSYDSSDDEEETLEEMLDDTCELAAKLQIPLDCVDHLKRDFSSFSQKHAFAQKYPKLNR